MEILDLPVVNIGEHSLEKVRNGMPVDIVDVDTDKNCKDLWKNILGKESGYLILVYNHYEICAVGVTDNNKIKVKKVFL